MEEPSVLDYLKSKIFPWKYPPVSFSSFEQVAEERTAELAQTDSPFGISEEKEESQPVITTVPAPKATPKSAGAGIPWISLAALVLAILAQASMAPAQTREWLAGVILLILSMFCLEIAVRRGDWQIRAVPQESDATDPPTIKLPFLVTGLVLAIAAFFSYSNLLFTPFNLLINLAALYFILRAFWIPSTRQDNLPALLRKFSRPLDIRLEPASIFKSLLIIAGVILVIFFRFYRIEQTPLEMNSDHAEKILDISRVLIGQTSIFFPNNGGREALADVPGGRAAPLLPYPTGIYRAQIIHHAGRGTGAAFHLPGRQGNRRAQGRLSGVSFCRGGILAKRYLTGGLTPAVLCAFHRCHPVIFCYGVSGWGNAMISSWPVYRLV